jgi:hypothetical protein
MPQAAFYKLATDHVRRPVGPPQERVHRARDREREGGSDDNVTASRIGIKRQPFVIESHEHELLEWGV